MNLINNGIEHHAFIPITTGKRPILAIHLQHEGRLNFAVFAMEYEAALRNCKATSESKAYQNAMEKLAEKTAGLPLDLYQVRVIPHGNGMFVPYLSLNPKEAVRHAARLRYTVWEAGGMNKAGKGAAQIVTNVAGARLIPAAVRKCGTLANGRHAAFSLFPGTNLHLVQSMVTDQKQVVRIGQVLWNDASDLPYVNIIWEGSDHRQVPEPFYDAACVALDKANKPNCREPMFIR